MITDLGTMLWKEWKEILFLRGSARAWLLNLGIFLGIFGVVMPLQFGRAWVEQPIGLAYWSWVPLLVVTSIIADSFAGERERHTLETLLASRLSDRAILFGKIAAGVSYGWGMALTGSLVGLVTVNVAHGKGQLLLPSPGILAGTVLFSFLAALLAAGAGVLVSLRAPTVRHAQQRLSLAMLLLIFVPSFGIPALPVEWRIRLAEAVAHAGPANLAAGAALAFLALDAAVIAVAMARFRRTLLILD